MKIVTFKDSSTLEEGLREIFFLSSSVTQFETPKHKEEFYDRWLGCYLKSYPETTWCAVEGDKVLGYLTVCPDTYSFLEKRPLQSLLLFKEYYQEYPAHLHMNTHPEARGKGIGSKLVKHGQYCLAEMGLAGWHLVTTEGERNVEFYKRQGMQILGRHEFKGSTLLLMGCQLSP